jgi:hypothetical protein
MISLPNLSPSWLCPGPHDRAHKTTTLCLSFRWGFWLSNAKMKMSFGSVILRFPTCSNSVSPLGLVFWVHTTSLYMIAAIPPHRGFGLSNVQMHMSSGLTIPQIPTCPLRISPPDYSLDQCDHYPRDLRIIFPSGFWDFQCQNALAHGITDP